MSAWSEVITTGVLAPGVAVAPLILLAAARWFGCLTWLPAPGAAGISVKMRLSLALLLAVVSLPATTGGATSEVQPQWLAGDGARWVVGLAGELILGSMLGLGVRVLFSALQLAGELIDVQAGLAMQQVMNPVNEDASGPSTAVLSWLAVALLFLAPPAGGDLALVEAMLQQFAAIPVGVSPQEGFGSEFLMVLVQQSLLLAVRLAGPVLGALSLMSMATAWLGRSTPGLHVRPLVAPVRVTVSLVLLSAALPGISEELVTGFDAVLQTSPAR